MLKKFSFLFVGYFVFAMHANASVIQDVVVQDEYVGWWDSHSYTHDLNDNGFVHGTALSGTLEVTISDDSTNFWDSWEGVLFVLEAFDFDSDGFTFGSSFAGNLELNALGAVNDDGLLDVTIQSLWGDFHVGNSTLTITTSNSLSPSAVPIPAAIWLFGTGLIGLIGFTRRRQAS